MSANNYSSSGSNLVTEQGYGEWTVFLYNPEGLFGTFKGYLTIAKDFHTIYEYKRNSVNVSTEKGKKDHGIFSQPERCMYL